MPLYGISPGACTENLIQAGMESLMPDGVSMRIYNYMIEDLIDVDNHGVLGSDN